MAVSTRKVVSGQQFDSNIRDFIHRDLGSGFEEVLEGILENTVEQLGNILGGEACERNPDLIVEVAHPDITKEFGAKFLHVSDYMIGSPTALVDVELFSNLRRAANQHGLYVPSGALWGGEDLQKMADAGTLQALKVTMTFHPESLKLLGSLKEKNELVTKRTILYEGCVHDLCSLAPNNVNTMAAAAIAGHNLGFLETQGCLISDPDVGDWHVVQVDAWGQGDIAASKAFHVQTVRRNPARVGSVTGSATRLAFLACLQRARGKGCGIHLC